MKLSLNPIRYEDIRSNIIKFLKENNNILSEFDFSGHNISMIIDTMAYTAMLLSYNLSNIANNIFIDTTNLRKNAVSIAKLIGYRPKRKYPAQIAGTIQYKGENFNKNSYIVIPPKTIFTDIEKGLPFLNLDAIKLTFKNSNTLEGSFVLYQGEFKEYRVLGTGQPLQSFVIPNENVAEIQLNVYVKNTSDPDYKKEKWYEVKTFFQIDKDNIYFVEEDIVNEYCSRIIFGTGTVGKIPSLTQTIIVEYLETKGSEGNGLSEFSLNQDYINTFLKSEDLHDLDYSSFEIHIPKGTYSFNGKDNETLDEIKQNAIRYFAAAGRGVTANDYKTTMNLYKEIFSFNTAMLDKQGIYDFAVTGANKIFKNYKDYLGNVFITGIPLIDYDNFQSNLQYYLSDYQENLLLAKLENIGIVATVKSFLKPTYLITEIYPSVEVSQNTSVNELNTIFNSVINNLKNFYKTYYAKLGVPFRKSKVQAIIDDTPGVKSSDLDIEFYFILNYDSFYRDRPTTIFLPVIYKKDEAGNIIYDEFHNPIKQNFIRTNTDIIQELHDVQKLDYTVYTLPSNLSSIFGKLSHKNLNRYLYNKDVITYDIVEIREYGDVKSLKGLQFLDNTYTIQYLYIEQLSSNIWRLIANNKEIAIIKYENNQYQIQHTPDEEQYLQSIGVHLPLKIIEKNDILVIQADVTNNIESDIRLQENANICDLYYDSDNFQINIQNPAEFKDINYQNCPVNYKNGKLYARNYELCSLDYDIQKAEFIISNYNQENCNMFGLRIPFMIENKRYLRAKGIFDEISIGKLFYDIGKLEFKQIIEGLVSTLNNKYEYKKYTINEIMNQYNPDYNPNKYDKIRIIPAKYVNELGNKVFYEDFDPNFSILCVPQIHDLKIKKV